MTTTAASPRLLRPTAASPDSPGGHLTTGWEPDVPTSDSLLRRFLFGTAAAADTFAVAAGGRTLRTDRFAAADYGRPSGFFNSATLLAPPGPGQWDGVVDEIEAFFGSAAATPTGDVVLWSAWPTPDLRDRGWHLEGHPPLLIRPPAGLLPPPALTATATPPVLVEVADAAALAEWERVAIEGYPLSGMLPVETGALVDPALLADPRLRFTLGRDAAGGRAVSIGALFVDDGLGYFTLGVTRPEARGGGHWRAHAVDRLHAAPDVWMTGVFSDFSRPQAEKLGFVPVVRFSLWTHTR